MSSPAQFLSLFGGSWQANQTGYDTLDNGAISQSGDSATVSQPNWLSNIQNIVGGAAAIASNVVPLVKAVSAQPAKQDTPAPANVPSATPAQPPVTAAAPEPEGKKGGWAGLVIVGLVIGGVLWFFGRKRK